MKPLINNDKKMIKFTGTPSRVFYPKPPAIINADEPFGIISFYIKEVVDGCIITNNPLFISVKGKFGFMPKSDTVYTITGYETQSQYGIGCDLIYCSEDISFDYAKEPEKVRAFLETIMTPRQTDNFLEAFTDPVGILQSGDTEAIATIKGIGKTTAENLVNKYHNLKNRAWLYAELYAYDIPEHVMSKLMAKYSSAEAIVNAVKEDPYMLCLDLKGVGFKTVDKIAISNGVDPTSPFRIRGFIYTRLKDLGVEGKSYITYGQLLNEMTDFFGDVSDYIVNYDSEEAKKTGAKNNIEEAINSLVEKEVVAIVDNPKKALTKIYLTYYYDLEKAVAEELIRIKNGKFTHPISDWQSRLEDFEAKQGWSYTGEQKKAAEMCINNNVCLITGYAGTGKTTSLNAVLNVLGCFDGRGASFAQCSLSGKAASRMSEVTGTEGFTIHRLLGYQQGCFAHNADNPISVDIIVLDEVSLVGGEIFLALLKAIPTGSKLIMLGDAGQLESIGCMNIIYDINNSDLIPHAKLTKIHRQAEKSGILTLSSEVRNGIVHKFSKETVIGELQDMHIIPYEDSVDDRVIDVYREMYEKYGSIRDVQILTPVKTRGANSVSKLNLKIQELVNPACPDKPEISITNSITKQETVYRKGDKVMCIKNNYRAPVELKDMFSYYDSEDEANRKTTAIFNGWTGVITNIDTTIGLTYIKFDLCEDTVVLTKGEMLSYIMLGYASTVHKYQGSQSKCIIGVLDYSTPPMMLTKELVYTMLTRAEKECWLLECNSAFRKAINTSGVSSKATFLGDFLRAG